MSLVRERVHAAGLSERVHLPGLIPDAGALFPAFDLFVLSSSTEGTPMTLLEAMQAGVPVVATAVGGVPDVLRDDAGWLVPPGDVTAFARAMQEALLDAVARVRRSAAAQATVRSRFSEPSWIARHLQLYAEVTSSVPPNRPAPPLA
jgi:glycosyltransferase involved in cell wall biosynthesis